MSEEKTGYLDDFPGEPKWWEPTWWAFTRFFDNWVYPAHYLRNLLFRRYDIVKLRNLKPYEYCDVVERMLYANMELIRFFIEKENPEKYVVWYKDDDGVDAGHKYGEGKEHGWEILYPEYDGAYIMDIIKEIYRWWTVDLPALQKEYDYLLHFCCDYCWGKMKSKPCKDNSECSTIEFDNSECPKTLEELEKNEIRWDIIDKYCDDDRKNIFIDGFMRKKLTKLEIEIDRQKQKYLHLCIEVRPYLWT